MSHLQRKLRQGIRYLGIGALLAVLVFIGLVLYPGPCIPFPAQDYEELLLRNITVIDVQGGGIAAISAYSRDTTGGAGEKCQVIDGTGRFLLPAYWDMHVHLTKRSPQLAYPAFIRHGVTHVRDMRGSHAARDPFAGYQPELEKWNAAVNNHVLLGPRLHGYASFAIDGPHARYKCLPSFFNCATPSDAQQLVAYLAGQKIILIKIYNNVPRQAFFTLMQEARKAGLEVAGHKPVRVSTAEAAQAGMKSLEHARFLLWDSIAGADSLQRQPDPLRRDNTALRQEMLAQHDPTRLHEIFTVLRRQATWYTPTHLTRKADALAGDPAFRARYNAINPILRFLAYEDLDATLQEATSALARQYKS